MAGSKESVSRGNYYLYLRDRHSIVSSDDEEGLVAQLVRARA
jgi:hypothetical protein